MPVSNSERGIKGGQRSRASSTFAAHQCASWIRPASQKATVRSTYRPKAVWHWSVVLIVSFKRDAG